MKLVAMLTVALVSFTGNCDATPGDAAMRSNHPRQAADLYRRGAEQVDALAAFKLGRLIESGQLQGDSYGTAGSWYVKACDQGNVVSCHNAGVGFEYGTLGLTQSFDEARSHYERAAQQGYMQSQYNLGSLYANQYFHNDIEGLAWLISAQAKAAACLPDPLCKWILDDPPGHIGHLKSVMAEADIAQAEKRSKNMAVSR